MARNNKIVRYRRPIRFNIGIIVFIFILCYFVIRLFNYATAIHVSVYEVVQGTLAANMTYTGLVLREEKIVTADTAGYLNFFPKEGSRVAVGDNVYSIDETGTYHEQILEAAQNIDNLDRETYKKIADDVSKFAVSYDDMNFASVSQYKTSLDAVLNEALSEEALKAVSSGTGQTFHIVTAKEPGIVSYNIDGYENVTTDNFTPDLYSPLTYEKTSLKDSVSERIEAGAAAYRLMTSEYWYMLVPADHTIQSMFTEETTVEVRFLKDNNNVWAQCSLVTKGGEPYLQLQFWNSAVRYIQDRYLQIELMLEKNSGLKIPKSSIVKKDFFTIPKEYFLSGDDTGSLGLLVKKEDSSEAEFVRTTIYYKKKKKYYISEEGITAGTVIVKPDSTETYTVQDTKSLKGVYNINKGYAVFKRIEITSKNEEYAIIKIGTDFGLSLYDHIALDGTSMTEGEIIQ